MRKGGSLAGEGGEQRCEEPICLPRKAQKIFFMVSFHLPGWVVVAPSCFALHCHCSLVSVQSVTVCMTLDATWIKLILFQLSVQNVYLPSLRTLAMYINGTVAS